MSQRACDRCHSIRARCQFSHGRDECDRCHRLHHDCRTDRKVLKAGRPRKTNVPRKRPRNVSSGESDLAALDSLEGFSSEEVRLARYFLQNQRFENSFAGDSDLSTSMQDAPVRLLLSAPGRIKDAMLALAETMIGEDASASAGDALERCCKALARLRSAETTSVEDANATLFAATSLISFNDMVIGHGFLPIARAALLSIEPWLGRLLERSPALGLDPNLIPVIFAEVSECVRCRELPTLRYHPPEWRVVDPSYGIAQDLLPQFYDICVLAHDINVGWLDSYETTQRALQILAEINSWTPAIETKASAQHIVELSTDQKAKIEGHGQCYKLLAKLLIYQLHHDAQDFDDSTTAAAANKLYYHITSLADETDSQTHVNYLLFPFFVACTELEDEEEQAKVLTYMRQLSGGIATQSCNRMYEFLLLVWAARRIDPASSWFDFVEDGVSFSIGP